MPLTAQRSRPQYGALGRSENSEAKSRPRALGPARLAARGSRRPHFLAAPGRARAAARTPSTAASSGGRAPLPGSRPPAGAVAPGPPRAPVAAALVCAL
uniref:Uncharacterized protein n=1 Tax=Piliocolobus tephrosceles TaxID=591936 RepID=A0A8C9H0H2_9PRIM